MRLADQLVDRIHHRAGVGEVFRLEMLRQRIEALAGPPRAHECLCEFVDGGLVHDAYCASKRMSSMPRRGLSPGIHALRSS